MPSDAPPGTYNHTVNATATGLIILPIPPVIITERVTTTVETTVIPEFSTIAIPAAIFVLLFFIRRRARNNIPFSSLSYFPFLSSIHLLFRVSDKTFLTNNCHGTKTRKRGGQAADPRRTE
ncbi:MAG: hypothetical protein OCU22_00660 [Canidatus Methanoxibalbensis ujae]|nr:hypothetical protein [Candidatus Methanoxibalbensis ujae]